MLVYCRARNTHTHTHHSLTHHSILYVLPSGNLTYLWKDPPFLMEKSTISMAIFNSYVNVYQRVTPILKGSEISAVGSLDHPTWMNQSLRRPDLGAENPGDQYVLITINHICTGVYLTSISYHVFILLYIYKIYIFTVCIYLGCFISDANGVHCNATPGR